MLLLLILLLLLFLLLLMLMLLFILLLMLMLLLLFLLLLNPCTCSRLELNGWDSVSKLESLSRRDLDYLGITGMEEQHKLLAAAARLCLGEERGRGDSLGSASPSFSPSSSRPCSSPSLSSLDLSLPSPPSELPSHPLPLGRLQPVCLSDSFLKSADDLSRQLDEGLRLDDGEEGSWGGRPLLVEARKTKKLHQSLTLSAVSSELNKSF